MVQIKRILCPTDFSPPARRALDMAVAFARQFQATIVLLHVVPPSAYPMRNFGAITGFPNLRDEIRKRIDEEMALLKASVKDVAVQAHVTDGVPHNQILEHCTSLDCDMIIMATHGHTGLKHALLGSVAERVVRLSEQPVLTIRAAEEQDEK